MDPYVKIVVLENEVQAEAVAGLLAGEGIPHRLRSYHDSALDGVLQGTYGWGHIEAPAEYKARILELVRSSADAPPLTGDAPPAAEGSFDEESAAEEP